MLQEDPFPEQVHGHDAFGAEGGSDDLPFLGKPLPRGYVEGVLVLQAAEEPAAAAGNLARVQGEALVLGQPQADGREVGEPGRAAEFTSTAAQPSEAGGLIACPDLPEIDAGPEPGGQVADEAPEVHPGFGSEKDGEAGSVPLPLRVHDLHGEAVVPGPFPDQVAHRLLVAPVFRRGGRLPRRGGPKDGPGHGRGGPGGTSGAGHGALGFGQGAEGAHPPQVESPLGLDDHGIIHAEGIGLAGPVKVLLAVSLEPDLDGRGHHPSAKEPIAAYFSARRRTRRSGRRRRSSCR